MMAPGPSPSGGRRKSISEYSDSYHSSATEFSGPTAAAANAEYETTQQGVRPSHLRFLVEKEKRVGRSSSRILQIVPSTHSVLVMEGRSSKLTREIPVSEFFPVGTKKVMYEYQHNRRVYQFPSRNDRSRFLNCLKEADRPGNVFDKVDAPISTVELLEYENFMSFHDKVVGRRIGSGRHYIGRLILTTYRLCFAPQFSINASGESSPTARIFESIPALETPVLAIAEIQLKDQEVLVLQCKDLRTIEFHLGRVKPEERSHFMATLEKLVYPTDAKDCFAFGHGTRHEVRGSTSRGRASRASSTARPETLKSRNSLPSPRSRARQKLHELGRAMTAQIHSPTAAAAHEDTAQIPVLHARTGSLTDLPSPDANRKRRSGDIDLPKYKQKRDALPAAEYYSEELKSSVSQPQSRRNSRHSESNGSSAVHSQEPLLSSSGGSNSNHQHPPSSSSNKKGAGAAAGLHHHRQQQQQQQQQQQDTSFHFQQQQQQQQNGHLQHRNIDLSSSGEYPAYPSNQSNRALSPRNRRSPRSRHRRTDSKMSSTSPSRDSSPNNSSSGPYSAYAPHSHHSYHSHHPPSRAVTVPVSSSPGPGPAASGPGSLLSQSAGPFPPHISRHRHNPSTGSSSSFMGLSNQECADLRNDLVLREYERMGLTDDNPKFRISYLNKNYVLCGSYPEVWVVPRDCRDSLLSKSSQFRSGARVPVVTWSDARGVTISRSSQPRPGVAGNRSKHDEALIQILRNTAAGENDNNKEPFLIMDARPKINAVTNKAKGKGYETSKTYENCQVLFMGIENIHVMRESLNQVKALAEDQSDDRWLTKLDTTKWMYHIKQVLFAGRRVVQAIEKDRVSVLVHCSDGWDRTSQVCAIAELLLDPFYRTIEGFQILIQKEWLWFGHKFADRTSTFGSDGVKNSAKARSERSPVFIQWLDCVYQLLCQFPTAFEFDASLLLVLAEHVHSGRFGTFFCCNEREREMMNVYESTPSIWPYITENAARGMYRNLMYVPPSAVVGPDPMIHQAYGHIGVAAGVTNALWPSCVISDLKLWKSYYCRWDDEDHDNHLRTQAQIAIQRNALRAFFPTFEGVEPCPSPPQTRTARLSQANPYSLSQHSASFVGGHQSHRPPSRSDSLRSASEDNFVNYSVRGASSHSPAASPRHLQASSSNSAQPSRAMLRLSAHPPTNNGGGDSSPRSLTTSANGRHTRSHTAEIEVRRRSLYRTRPPASTGSVSAAAATTPTATGTAIHHLQNEREQLEVAPEMMRCHTESSTISSNGIKISTTARKSVGPGHLTPAVKLSRSPRMALPKKSLTLHGPSAVPSSSTPPLGTKTPPSLRRMPSGGSLRSGSQSPRKGDHTRKHSPRHAPQQIRSSTLPRKKRGSLKQNLTALGGGGGGEQCDNLSPHFDMTVSSYPQHRNAAGSSSGGQRSPSPGAAGRIKSPEYSAGLAVSSTSTKTRLKKKRNSTSSSGGKKLR